jgi:transcription-repair coupling factor (superfamily II helicase)
LQHIQTQTKNARLKQVGKNFMLLVDRIKNMRSVENFLQQLSPKKIEKKQGE